MSTYEILALNYTGNVIGSGAFVRWLSDWDKQIPRTYFYWLVRKHDVNVLIDCGCRPDQAETAELPGYVTPWEMLGRLRLSTDDIGHLVLTHLHWDHAGALAFFPKAHIWVHHAEYHFWLEDPVARKPPFELVSDRLCLDRLAELKGTERLTIVEQDSELLPGIRGIFAPGHTPGLMAVGVNTAQGQAVLGSDCGHMFANYADEWPSSLITDLPAWLRSFEKLKALAASKLLFPGHDPLMAGQYKTVAENITKLV